MMLFGTNSLRSPNAFVRVFFAMYGILFFSLISTACNLLSTDQFISANNACEAGTITLPGTCGKLCETDKECPRGYICHDDGILSNTCLMGQRLQAPRIDSIDGDGTFSHGRDETAHHLAHGIIVTGDHFTGADVLLHAPRGPIPDITVIARTAQRLEIALPITVTDEGVYRLHVRGQAGEVQQSFLIMRGETGATGFPGANLVTRIGLYATTTITDNTTTAISIDNPDLQISNSFHFPSAATSGILLAAMRVSDHHMLDAPFASNWFTNSNTLNVTLNSLAEDAFIIMASRGDVSSWLQSNGTETALASTMRQFGAMPGVHALLGTEAFVFVGRRGIGHGNGIFIAGPGRASTSVTLADDDAIGNSTTNFGVCARNSPNCVIPASNIVGTLTAAQLPGGLADLASTTQANGSVTISTPITLEGAVNITGNASACSMSLPGFGNALAFAWNSANAVGNDYNNRCYGIFTTPTGSTPKTWYEAQLACNSIGAHLATFTADSTNTTNSNAAQIRANNELAVVTGKLATLPANTIAWIGISNYEGAIRWVGSDGAVTNAAITLPANANVVCGAINSTITGTSPTQKPLTNTTYNCTSTVPTAFVCERASTPFSQPCAQGWWPINGGRLCMEASMRPSAVFRTAASICQKNSLVAARVCSYADMSQACGAGMNAYSSGLTTLSPIGAGWYNDHNADDIFSTWNANVCIDNNDGASINSNATALQYRCCY